MRVSREQAAASREKILDAAAKGFRERGLDGIGVADLMKEAGFTHGGFYAHFDSKEDLMAEACGRALDGSLARWRKLQAEEPQGALRAIVDHYLSPRHLADRATGCTIAALASDVARHGPAVRSAVTARLRALMSILADAMPGRTRAARRRKALAAYASLVGAVVLARAVNDPVLSGEILGAVAEDVISRA
jgi:TetR/AcrR family transcriptional regulator, transcriptional repressor for nem operon